MVNPHTFVNLHVNRFLTPAYTSKIIFSSHITLHHTRFYLIRQRPDKTGYSMVVYCSTIEKVSRLFHFYFEKFQASLLYSYSLNHKRQDNKSHRLFLKCPMHSKFMSFFGKFLCNSFNYLLHTRIGFLVDTSLNFYHLVIVIVCYIRSFTKTVCNVQ